VVPVEVIDRSRSLTARLTKIIRDDVDAMVSSGSLCRQDYLVVVARESV
jgi:hypothetical protein